LHAGVVYLVGLSLKPRQERLRGVRYSCFDLEIALVAISPHLDDVVLGCAGVVAANPGALVVTVTAGRPAPHPLTDWDRKCGFGEGDDVVGARRKEDEAALRLLGARPRWLEFLDHQYGPAPASEAVVKAIAEAIEGADVVASPLGLFHEDHVLTARACSKVARHTVPLVRWLIYEDAIYRDTPGRTEDALRDLRNDGFVPRDATFPEPAEKVKAMLCYPSQVRGLGRLLDDAYRPEHYWELAVT